MQLILLSCLFYDLLVIPPDFVIFFFWVLLNVVPRVYFLV